MPATKQARSSEPFGKNLTGTNINKSISLTILRTQRTSVDSISLSDAEFFVDLVNSPEWLRFIGSRNVSNTEDARDYLEQGFLRSYRDHGFGYYLIRLHSGTPIGICGFLKKPNLENPDFGFALLPEYYGKGYGFESASEVLKYGITTFKFDVLDAVTSAENIRSQRLLDRLEFRRHGSIKSEGDFEDLFLYRRKFGD